MWVGARVIAGNRDGVPIASLDIDGTLGDYHAHFLEFASNWFGRDFPDPHTINPGLRLSTFMGVPHHEYRQCKLAYRQGGLKRWMPAYPGAGELTRELRALGIDVWICTTRPFNRLDNIDPDTQEWLRRNGVVFDGLLFGEDKYHELHRQIHGRRIILGVAEDLPELCDQAIDLNMPVVIRDQPYNQHYIRAARAHDCEGILKFIREHKQWIEEGPYVNP